MKHSKHTHIYDSKGRQICCSLEEKIDAKTPPPLLKKEHSEDDGHDHSHDGEGTWKTYFPAIISFVLLVSGIALDYYDVPFFNGWVRLLWYGVAYIPVGLPVIKEAVQALGKGEIFTEFFLMSIATIGAIAIGEYPEGVAVMLFYAVGELFQSAAVRRAKNNIKALLDVRPKIANVFRNGSYITVNPSNVNIEETIQVKVGEKIPLDGTLLSDKASLNTAAITGESKPQSTLQGENVLAGSINMDGVIEIKTTKLFNDSSVARIIELVQNATSKKAKTELLIRRLAKVYTPIVVYLAIAVCFLPYFFVDDYVFRDWLYRALIFIVISCPCALVISIPLGYFGGLGAASKNGILFKGAKYLDKLKEVNTIVMDKTGTVTKGVFRISEIKTYGEWKEETMMPILLAIESKSTHPIAKAIMEYQTDISIPNASDIKEIAGKGLTGLVQGKNVVVGNQKLMQQFNIDTLKEIESIVDSIVLVGIDGVFAGYVTIADELKEEAKASIESLKREGIKSLMMLSGDKNSITQKVAAQLGIEKAKGGLLPEDKLNEVERIKQDKQKKVAFIGDGINDAPVLAASDVGIAMGAMGSDVAIETADVIIQTDQLSKISTGIQISKSTQKIIWQNIFLAFGVKIIVLILGAGGLATMWEAVFADVGVALLAILNAVRLQRMKWI
ncbi:MAG: cadmium-translocating P-type ATPase [Flavobacteriaceae bacterium]|nr:MAG: cadmium-translocating P-type ATPase [Flavobacteriaceae bacterium]